MYKYVLAALNNATFNAEYLARIAVLLEKKKILVVPLKYTAMADLSSIVSDKNFLLVRNLLGSMLKNIDEQFIADVLSENISTKDKMGEKRYEKFRTSSQVGIIFDEEIRQAAYWLCVIGITECEKEIRAFCE